MGGWVGGRLVGADLAFGSWFSAANAQDSAAAAAMAVECVYSRRPRSSESLYFQSLVADRALFSSM